MPVRARLHFMQLHGSGILSWFCSGLNSFLKDRAAGVAGFRLVTYALRVGTAVGVGGWPCGRPDAD